ncbi:MAG: helicase-related protein [Longimicrobiales bacterium]
MSDDGGTGSIALVPSDIAAARVLAMITSGYGGAVTALPGLPRVPFGSAPPGMTNAGVNPPAGRPIAGFTLSSFQHEALDRADHILRARGGVLIADSVGLGKTVIALGLIDRCMARDTRHVIVTAPAALRSHWVRPLGSLAASRRIDFTNLRHAPGTGPWIAFLSHSALALLGPEAECIESALIIVDESHAFRNPRTHRARALARLCRHARVVLLSATPINNSLMDLYSQIRLFLGDGALADLGVPDLRQMFQSIRAGQRVPSLAVAIRAVTVRRTRAELVARFGADPAVRFPRRAAPVPITYDAALNAHALAVLARLDLAPFRLRPASGGRVAIHGANPELLRYVLLKRIESGRSAFSASVRRLIRFLEAFERAAAEGRLLTARAHRADGGSQGDQLTLAPLLSGAWPPGVAAGPWLDSARTDLAHLRGLDIELRAAGPDPKVEQLKGLLDGRLSNAKVLVFTEFRETARQLFNALGRRSGVALIDGSGAWLASGRASRGAVIALFSPLSNQVRPPPERERVDVLIATDVLSEGLNLQDASVVINYDLPWNPVRLIQRTGRIDRLGSPHDVIRTFSFLPGGALESMLGLLDRIETKLAAIRTGLGPGDNHTGLALEPRAALSQVVAGLARGDADLLDRIERAHETGLAGDLHPGTHDPGARARGASIPGQADDGDAGNEDPPSPLAAVAFSHAITEAQFLLVLSCGGMVRFALCDRTGNTRIDTIDGVGLLHSLRSGDDSRREGDASLARSLPADDDAKPPRFDHFSLERSIRVTEEKLRAPVAGPLVVRIAKRLSRLAANVPGGLDPVSCTRVDRILRVLRGGLRTGLEAELAGIVFRRSVPDAKRTHASFCEMLERIEALLDVAPRSEPPDAIRLLAAFDLRPAGIAPYG